MKKMIKSMSMLALLGGMSSTQAALVNFEIIGDVLDGTGANDFGLFAGDTIVATGTFDDSVFTLDGDGNEKFSFAAWSGNTFTINLNGTILDQSMDLEDSASISFDGNDQLVNFDFWGSSFNSLLTDFDDIDTNADVFGTWRTDVTFTPAVVPVPAAVWLFGSGLLGLIGVARRKQV